MAVDIRSTANFGAYLKDRCKVIGARIKSDGTQVRFRDARGGRSGGNTRRGLSLLSRWFPLPSWRSRCARGE